MTAIDKAPMCLVCRHFNNKVYNKNLCAAFPEGIPYKIFYDHLNHEKSYPGDHGIRFKAKGDSETN